MLFLIQVELDESDVEIPAVVGLVEAGTLIGQIGISVEVEAFESPSAFPTPEAFESPSTFPTPSVELHSADLFNLALRLLWARVSFCFRLISSLEILSKKFKR